MISYQLICSPAEVQPQGHLIAPHGCSLLRDSALLAEMHVLAQDKVADTRFGCAPFTRITLLPDALWQDSLTEGLLNAIRPLLASPVSENVLIDVTEINDTVLALLLRFLFNQAYTLNDLQLKKRMPPPLASAISPRSASQNNTRNVKNVQAAAGHCQRHDHRKAAGGYPLRLLYAAVRGQ